MARVPNVEKLKYTPIGEEELEGEDAPCFYCGQPSCMDDLTPHPKALEVFKSTFSEEWTRARTCRLCWGRIYTANIVNSGQKFQVQRGCMTIAQKKELLGISEESLAKRGFILNIDKTMVVPSVLVKVEGGPFLYNGKTIHEDELRALQGAMLLRMHDLDESLVEMSLEGAMASHLDLDRLPLYREILRLPETKETW